MSGHAGDVLDHHGFAGEELQRLERTSTATAAGRRTRRAFLTLSSSAHWSVLVSEPESRISPGRLHRYGGGAERSTCGPLTRSRGATTGPGGGHPGYDAWCATWRPAARIGLEGDVAGGSAAGLRARPARLEIARSAGSSRCAISAFRLFGEARGEGPAAPVGEGCAGSDFDALEPGSVAVAATGGCLNFEKARNAARAGALALIVAGDFSRRGVPSATLAFPARLPVLLVGARAKRALLPGGVSLQGTESRAAPRRT